jgi:hypothetical protein
MRDLSPLYRPPKFQFRMPVIKAKPSFSEKKVTSQSNPIPGVTQLKAELANPVEIFLNILIIYVFLSLLLSPSAP